MSDDINENECQLLAPGCVCLRQECEHLTLGVDIQHRHPPPTVHESIALCPRQQAAMLMTSSSCAHCCHQPELFLLAESSGVILVHGHEMPEIQLKNLAAELSAICFKLNI